MSRVPNLKEVVFKDTSFANLMQKRIYNVLLIATRYDAFMLEDDGRVDEQIFNEYTSLGLHYPPRFTQVSTEEEAMATLAERNFELVICMPNMDNTDPFRVGSEIKSHYPEIPIVVLTPFSREVSRRIEGADLSNIDYIFSWLGDAELLVAIIKLLEDKMNAPFDTASVGVQTILLVEDSIRFYSSALPHLFNFVLQQSQEFSKEALNDHQQTLRMRGRPKIMLARSYEEASLLYNEYKDNILGIISDFSFMRCGRKDPLAGLRFAQMVRDKDPMVPIIMESSEKTNQVLAEKLKTAFIYKNSKSYPQDLRRQVRSNFGFGDFVIINPKTGAEIMRIRDLKDLQKKIFSIPDDSLAYHLSCNHFSRFFYSRAMFPPAELLKKVDVGDYSNMDEARLLIHGIIVEYRRMKNSGVVAIYNKERFDEYSNFARIGNGSLGGKGRGLAFMSAMVKRNPEFFFDNTDVQIPHTVVLCTDVFDEFMEKNNLYPIALDNSKTDQEILSAFEAARLPERVIDDVLSFFDVVKSPIAVRSSSLLEDSHYQPFAGVYSTYMVPQLSNRENMIASLRSAIKGVYASVFYRDSKTYMLSTQNLIDQEKMAVVIQEVVGCDYNGKFYPIMSGVARSLNFYPVGNEKCDEGVANVALGLGKYIVDGGTTLRFSPAHPHHIMQTSTLDLALRDTQTLFYALPTKEQSVPIQVSDDYNLMRVSVRDAENDDSLKYAASTYDPYDMVLNDGVYPNGRKVITFSNLLQNEAFPVAEVLRRLLHIGQKEMGRPVEIEFAVNIPPAKDAKATFYMLQIRPIVDSKGEVDRDLSQIPQQQAIIITEHAMGQGTIDDVNDLIVVKQGEWSSARSQQIADELQSVNREFTELGKGYALIGPGRWGSSDPWLGIPVKWPHISNARLIVESTQYGPNTEPSQGTHFFQNLTSLGVGYFTLDDNNDFLASDWLNGQYPAKETKSLLIYHWEKPTAILMDGRHGKGILLKPSL